MRRITLLLLLVLLLLTAGVLYVVLPQVLSARKYTKAEHKVIYSSTGPNINIYSSAVSDTVRLMVFADTHLWMSDEREEPYREYSARMAGAYHSVKHFQTGAPTTPEESFLATIRLAQQRGVDAIAMLGDIVSYPSERGVEWIGEVLDTVAIPCYYTSGNHDWHYEGMEGSSESLREKWRGERLMSLFGDNDPDAYAVEVKGVRLLLVDDSNYKITPEQRDAVAAEVKSGKPFILMHHIPLYAPSRSVSFGIGHPEWSAATDKNYKIERREQWPAEGHTEVDYEFYDLATTAPNLLASIAGHVHSYGVDIIHGRPHYTVGANAQGAYYIVNIMPL
ncbi:MAG: metallophosphoesterase [Alistipes sp.]|nr:metallophosphoesterase [Alistipes sp.]